MTKLIIYIIYFLALVIGILIFYYVAKAAVRNGINEALAGKSNQTIIKENKPESVANSEQRKLQQRYDNGEISFEVYQSEWNKAKT